MGWSPNHKRMRPSYSPYLTAAEKRHEKRVQEQPCFNCGRWGSEAHHTRLQFPGKRWKRDHRFRLPLCSDCHRGPRGIHSTTDAKWLVSIGKTEAETIAYVQRLWAESERAEALSKVQRLGQEFDHV